MCSLRRYEQLGSVFQCGGVIGLCQYLISWFFYVQLTGYYHFIRPEQTR